MSATVVVDVDLPAVSTWGGRPVAVEGTLRVEVPPVDIAAGHRAIDRLAERAHTELRAAAAKIAEQDPDNPA